MDVRKLNRCFKIASVKIAFAFLVSLFMIIRCADKNGTGDQPTSPATDENITVKISSPTTGSSFTSGEEISFKGSATDEKQRLITGENLIWTSDIDQIFGIGSAFKRSGLNADTHQLS